MSHLDIWSTSYGQKKVGSQIAKFDSQPLKVKNRPNPDACRWKTTCCWKSLKESYKFASNLIPIGGLSKKLWSCKIAGLQIRTVLRLPLGSLGTKSHSDVGAAKRRKEYYMGESGGFLRVQAVMSLVSPESPMACPSIKGVIEGELTKTLFLVPSWSSNTPFYPF
jgi:hypothetical protein